MNDSLKERLRAAGAEIDPHWDDARMARAEQKMLATRRRRYVVGRVVRMSAMLLVVGAAGALWWKTPQPAQRPPTEAARPAIVIADGSRIERLSEETKVEPRSVESTRVVIALARGTARFSVSKQPGRIFRVEAGNVAVEVLGTRFIVERGATLQDSVRVKVEEGRVRVIAPNETRVLGIGEHASFAQELEAAPARVDAPAPATAPTLSPPTLPPPKTKAPHRASDAALPDAEETLRGPPGRLDAVEALLAEADVARLSEQPERALSPLSRIVDQHNKDARAPLAAFSLGRLLLDRLDRPRDAALAFAKVQLLDPSGPLVEDALAREVEAWARATELSRAHDRALVYIDKFPAGQKLKSVKRLGAVE